MDPIRTLYISDLDGTLLNRSAKLSEYTTNSLNSMIANGLNFSIATARLLAPVQKMLANVNVDVPVILMNGALIYDINQRSYVKVNMLPSDAVAFVIDAIRMYEVTGFMYELSDGNLITYHETPGQGSLHPYIEQRITRYLPINGFSSQSSQNTVFFTLINTRDRLQPIHDVLEKQPGLSQTLYKNVYCPDLWYLEVYSTEASKYNAVIFLKQTYGFDRVIGFGDGLNDLPLFSACDECIAVENAISEVKAAAGHICGSNDDDGVAKWIEGNFGINLI